MILFVLVSLVKARLKALIIYIKQLLDSDWLRAVRFKCNTRCKKCNTIANYTYLDYDKKFSKPMISRKMTKQILCGNWVKSLLE